DGHTLGLLPRDGDIPMRDAAPIVLPSPPSSLRWLAISRMALRVLPSLISFPLILLLQIRAGYELSVFPLYIIPVMQLAWEFGWKGATAGTIVGTCLWVWGNDLSGWQYSQDWMRLYNGLVRAVLYAFCASGVLLFRRTLETHRRRLEA